MIVVGPNTSGISSRCNISRSTCSCDIGNISNSCSRSGKIAAIVLTSIVVNSRSIYIDNCKSKSHII